jgi:predicted Rossmann fold nucleotide-binding protein DprA/Smf involved in DNA uptake
LSDALPLTIERAARAALSHFADILPPEAGADIAAHGAAETWARLTAGPYDAMADYPSMAELERGLQAAEFVIPGDGDWPTALDDLGPGAPPGIWARGAERLPDLTTHAVCVTGNRSTTPLGARVAELLSGELSRSGCTVTATSAHGVSTSAIYAAARCRRDPVLLVLPCGPDRSHPGNLDVLHRDVLDNGGALVSTARPYTFADSRSIAAAPGLTAALARATVVVESGNQDSDRHTAEAVATARRLGRPLLAVDPGPVRDVNEDFHTGNYDLIVRGIARPVDRTTEVLAALPPGTRRNGR